MQPTRGFLRSERPPASQIIGLKSATIYCGYELKLARIQRGKDGKGLDTILDWS